jgi:hypothetical protein
MSGSPLGSPPRRERSGGMMFETDSTDSLYLVLADSEASEVRVTVDGSSDVRYVAPETADKTVEFNPPLSSSHCCLLT